MLTTGYVIGESDKAIALVRTCDVRPGVKPLWVPRSKILSSRELDTKSSRIETDKGTRIGTPVEVDIDESFLAKVGLA